MKLKKVFKRLLSIIAGLVVIAAIIFAVCGIAGKTPFVAGYSVRKILTESMEPVIPAESYIFVKKVSVDDINVGDVIMFYSDDPQIKDMLNTHRVVNIIEKEDGDKEFVTKGDNNTVEDKYHVMSDKVVAKYERNLSVLTTIMRILSIPGVFFAIVVIPAAFLFVTSIIDFRKKLKEVHMDVLVNEELDRLKQNKEEIKEIKGVDDVRKEKT